MRLVRLIHKHTPHQQPDLLRGCGTGNREGKTILVATICGRAQAHFWPIPYAHLRACDASEGLKAPSPVLFLLHGTESDRSGCLADSGDVLSDLRWLPPGGESVAVRSSSTLAIGLSAQGKARTGRTLELKVKKTRQFLPALNDVPRNGMY